MLTDGDGVTAGLNRSGPEIRAGRWPSAGRIEKQDGEMRDGRLCVPRAEEAPRHP